MKQIKISDAAAQDLVIGFKFYENQEQGIGHYFLDSLYSDIDSLALYAGIHPVYFKKYHRMLAMRFPFAIYYTCNNDFVYVNAVLDCRKEPSWLKEYLS
ncbi:MAG: hypothetical protein R3E90_09925 [Marinicella sp.]